MKKILSPFNNSQKNIIRSGEKAEWLLPAESVDLSKSHRLFFTCEDRMYEFLKDEPFGEKLYMLIDDSLNTDYAECDRYCLDMSTDDFKPYMKAAFKKISWQPLKFGIYPAFDYSEIWQFSIKSKADNLKFKDDGYLRLRIDKWYIKDGVDVNYTGAHPDESEWIDIKSGTYDYTFFSKEIHIDTSKTACIFVTLEGINYSGKVYFECPKLLSSNGYNMLPPFEQCTSRLSNYSWLGLNLSKKEWPHFKISVNNKPIADREFFLAIHRFSNVELDIPEGFLTGKDDKIIIEYLSAYHDTVPLEIGECYLLEDDKKEFNIIYCPDMINEGDNLSILVETSEDNMEFEIKSEDFKLISDNTFSKKGLNIITLKPVKFKEDLSFCVKYGEEISSFTLKALPQRNDSIIVGSGDAIYIDMSDTDAVAWFLKWFIKNELGNLITVRPVYRWGGQRYINKEAYELFVRICTGMGISYVNLSDGRDLPGLAQNPPEDLIKSKYFLGKQLHERDGQLFYWGVSPRENDPVDESFFDMALRIQRDNPYTTEGAYRPENIILRDSVYSFKRNINCNADMQEAKNLASLAIADMSKDGFIRHTGPSVTFKYFYESGFNFLGAETLDGSFEPQLAFLRGASKAYRKKRYGIHHALQWSTVPHDCEKRYRRYMLALFLSYMHGVTDINTEEGFYFFEARYCYHNRLSDACEAHRKIERDFYKYVKSNNRRGTFSTDTAFIHGRLDGWNGFTKTDVWGMPHIQAGDACASWELLKVFYPLCEINITGMKKTGYISPEQAESVGYYSGTPYGNVDCIPIENSDFSSYKLLCFAGYNKAEKEDMDRLCDFVKGGGVLVCTKAHFTTATNRADIENNNLDIIVHPLTQLIFDNENEDMKAYRINLGKGHITLLNTDFYPGNELVFEKYSGLIREEQQALMQKERITVSCGTDVEYTKFVCDDGSIDFYFAAVDWYNDSTEPRKAILTVDGISRNIDVPFGEIIKIGGIAYLGSP